MIYKSADELSSNDVFAENNGYLLIKDKSCFRCHSVDALVNTIVFGESELVRNLSCWIACSAASEFNIFPASIQGLYAARGRGEVAGFTVPAINLRTMTYDLARAIFRSAKKINAAAFIFEITRGEIKYTAQRPIEYAAMVILAAIKESYTGPLFLQADHFQVDANRYSRDKEVELSELKELIAQAVAAGFYNIDVDSSTLTDISRRDLDGQQEENCRVCADLTKFIRRIQPSGVEISVGGEIGEIGGNNTTADELRAFMNGYRQELGSFTGISKISVQTGTCHGGVMLPDGTIAHVKLDFDTLKNLSDIVRNQYGLAGCVQQGASTLPNEAFHNFPEVGCAEIHLATQFQNIVYDYLPISLKERVYSWLKEHCSGERKPEHNTDAQFIYAVRKRALGIFKPEIFALKHDLKGKIAKAMEDEIDFLFNMLNIKDTRTIVEKFVPLKVVTKHKEDFFPKAV